MQSTVTSMITESPSVARLAGLLWLIEQLAGTPVTAMVASQALPLASRAWADTPSSAVPLGRAWLMLKRPVRNSTTVLPSTVVMPPLAGVLSRAPGRPGAPHGAVYLYSALAPPESPMTFCTRYTFVDAIDTSRASGSANGTSSSALPLTPSRPSVTTAGFTFFCWFPVLRADPSPAANPAGRAAETVYEQSAPPSALLTTVSVAFCRFLSS